MLSSRFHSRHSTTLSGLALRNSVFKAASKSRFATAAVQQPQSTQTSGSPKKESDALRVWKKYPKWGRINEVIDPADMPAFEEYWKSDKVDKFDEHWDQTEFSAFRMISEGRLVHYMNFLMLKHDPTFNAREAINTAIEQCVELSKIPMYVHSLPNFLLRRSQCIDMEQWVEYRGGYQKDNEPNPYIQQWYGGKVIAPPLDPSFWDGAEGLIVLPRVSRYYNECKLFVRIRTPGLTEEGLPSGVLHCMTSPLPKEGEKFQWTPYGWPEFARYIKAHSFIRKVETPLFPAPDELSDLWD